MSKIPPFESVICSALPLTDGGTSWVPIISCKTGFSAQVFEAAILQLLHHPEYNSTLILRSEQISECDSDFPGSIPQLTWFHPVRCLRRRLLARRPERDPSIQQLCTFYSTESDCSPIVVVLTPIMEPDQSLPYYHPTVHHIAFRYLCAPEGATTRVEVQPLPGTPTDPNSRLYRTCLALLQTVHKYGWGTITNYRKRVLHDCLVAREPYQDLYLIMRERHKHLINTWQEVTDPLKHVFEDIGIATYLMLLWKETYSEGQPQVENNDQNQPWRTWPRPPGGFLDFGCGNGLLTHILITEGYEGYGIDLRSRISWSHYSAATQARLQVHTFDPLAPFDVTTGTFFKPGIFIIGNHADELTPWIPVVATLVSASGYMSIPCCPWTFDMRYDRSKISVYPIPPGDFVESLNLGGSGNNDSSYAMYRIWLASLSLHCGWEVECEVLRIPSTRNWSIISRKGTKWPDDCQALSNAQRIVEEVRQRGIFKARKPESRGH
ncbi:putative AdoMet-dependent methyltransferase domain containing protein [Amanita muscaria]